MKQHKFFASLILTITFLFTSLLPSFYSQKVFARDLPDSFLGPVMVEKSNTQPFRYATFYSALFQPLPPAINQTTIQEYTEQKKQMDPITASRSAGFVNASTKNYKYTIQHGDTLYDIANSYHVNMQQLIAANHIQNPSLLITGDTLSIPISVMNAGTPPLAGARTILSTLTAYTSGYESTGKLPGDPGYGITSTGTHATQGRTIAVDPRVIPYGSRVFIPGLGIRYAEDTGGAIKGSRIDVYFNNVNVALSFGVKHDIPVYILPNSNTNNFASANTDNFNTNPPL